MTKITGDDNMTPVFSEMTEKMQMLYLDIVGALGQLPQEKKAFMN